MSDFKKLWKREKWFYIGVMVITCLYCIKIIRDCLNFNSMKECLEIIIEICPTPSDKQDYYGFFFNGFIATLNQIHFYCGIFSLLILFVKYIVINANYSLQVSLPFSKKGRFLFDTVMTYVTVFVPILFSYIYLTIYFFILKANYGDYVLPSTYHHTFRSLQRYTNFHLFKYTFFALAIFSTFMFFRQLCKKLMEQLCVTILTLLTIFSYPLLFAEYFVEPVFKINYNHTVIDFLWIPYSHRSAISIMIMILSISLGYHFSKKEKSLDYELFNYKGVKVLSLICVFLWASLLVFSSTTATAIEQGKGMLLVIFYSVLTLLFASFITGGLGYVFRRR